MTSPTLELNICVPLSSSQFPFGPEPEQCCPENLLHSGWLLWGFQASSPAQPSSSRFLTSNRATLASLLWGCPVCLGSGQPWFVAKLAHFRRAFPQVHCWHMSVAPDGLLRQLSPEVPEKCWKPKEVSVSVGYIFWLKCWVELLTSSFSKVSGISQIGMTDSLRESRLCSSCLNHAQKSEWAEWYWSHSPMSVCMPAMRSLASRMASLCLLIISLIFSSSSGGSSHRTAKPTALRRDSCWQSRLLVA